MSGLYYPQIRSAIAQFPMVRRLTTPAYVNEVPSGLTFRMADVTPEETQWTLQYSELTTAEWQQLASLFNTAAGRLGTFTFLDPADNLLLWSEDFTQNVWTAGPLLSLTGGFSDPTGGISGVQITNTSQVTATLMQEIGGPSWYQYAFSIYLQAHSPCTVNLLGAAGNQNSRKPARLSSAWSRAVLSLTLPCQQDGIQFGLEIPAGVGLRAFGAQVEAQPGAGLYKKTTNKSGVYLKSRFDQDVLTQTTDAVEKHSTSVRVITLS
ncbi:MAG TPA: hypothetical protein VKU01_16190 [Bryobacteraceae bacterium]|nr:hypothetical protein [Bryobacteraceae bacterium]